MAKRKPRPVGRSQEIPSTPDTFPDSEDDFYTSKDRILVDEAPAAKRRRRLEQESQELQPSDEEVLSALSDDLHDDDGNMENTLPTDDDTAERASQGSGASDGYWGPSTSDYYNADAIETEADALEEEAEARRLRQKQLKRMTDADFGFDEMQWMANDATEQHAVSTKIVEKLPAFHIPQSATNEERWDIIRARYPEFEPLLQNLLEVHRVYQGYLKEPTKSKVLKTKIRASVAYMAAVVMYISVLTFTKKGIPLPPSELREHPIIDTLLRCQQAWEIAKGIDERVEQGKSEIPTPNNPSDLMVVPDTSIPAQEIDQIKKKMPQMAKTRQPPLSEFDDLDSFAPIPSNIALGNVKSNKKAPKSKAVDIADILAQANSASIDDNHDYFGDEDPLKGEEAVEKARKKNSLRFYTSQIAQKANTRKMAARLAGGDDDLPYKERRRDRDNHAAREKDKKTITLEEDEVFDTGSEGNNTALVDNEANEYYNSLVSASMQKKSEKRARANAYLDAAQHGVKVYQEEELGPDGKRKITYAIEKNKGLVPKRKKEVRNPRVKKKMRYEQKMKKLGSIKPLYKGGEGKGGYSGELTGIKTNLVKSVKL